MTNPENLEPHQYQPGQSGNPKGKPKGIKNSKTQLRKWLALDSMQKAPEGEGTVDYFDAILLKTMKDALAGDTNARRDIFDRLEGKPNQSLDLTERKPDDLEKMSTTELKEHGENLIKKLKAKIDSGNSGNSES